MLDEERAKTRPALPIQIPATTPHRLRVYSTMATWCAACTKTLPELADAKTMLAEEGVQFIGVPVDVDDDMPKLQKYLAQHKPAYQLLGKLTYRDRDALKAFLESSLPNGNVPLPSTVIANQDNEVLQVLPGIPSVSDLRKWLP